MREDISNPRPIFKNSGLFQGTYRRWLRWGRRGGGLLTKEGAIPVKSGCDLGVVFAMSLALQVPVIDLTGVFADTAIAPGGSSRKGIAVNAAADFAVGQFRPLSQPIRPL